jgi:8-oxo-dGTP pyrophosphatase MutT (NUDIX family)
MNKNNLNICNNCGKHGHMFYQCKLPITSYGIILFTYDSYLNSQEVKFLMIRRKDTFGYIDFIRGKYSPYNNEHIQNIIDEMSLSEKERILSEPFEQLWKNMWGYSSNHQNKNEENACTKKFEIIKNGIQVNDVKITLKEIVENSFTSWEETEWEFPKGRRDFEEKDLDCALREFEEETGIEKTKIQLIENIMPFEETFIGSNHKSYKHKYFLAFIDNNFKDPIFKNPLMNYQKTEVSKMEWKTIDECLECIRPYHLEKKDLIQRIYKVIQEYRLYS